MMSINSVAAMYFSPTGTTRRAVARIAEALSGAIGCRSGPSHRDFTLPGARKERARFGDGDVVVFGVPVHAGRVPKVLVDYVKTVQGNGALAIAVVVYGNRDYDDALIELSDLLEEGGFTVVAGAAFIGEHSYSSVLAQGRPDKDDLALAEELATRVSKKLLGAVPIQKAVVKGNRPYREFPVSRNEKGERIDPSRARPKTSSDCLECGTCVEVCPMGSIDPDDVSKIDGNCIRCNACVKACPSEAKYFSDNHYLVVKRWLETHCTERRTPELFL